MGYKYSSSFNSENEARALGKDLNISTKQSIEICSFIRGRDVEEAKGILEEVIVLKKAVPYKRFNADLGHKRGKIAAGRYPVNASKAILSIIKLAEANAQNKGLSGTLNIRHISAQKASKPMKHGRKHGLEEKRTHIEIIVTETEKKAPKKEKKDKEKSPVEKKTAAHPAQEKTAEPKKEAEQIMEKPEVKND